MTRVIDDCAQRCDVSKLSITDKDFEKNAKWRQHDLQIIQ